MGGVLGSSCVVCEFDLYSSGSLWRLNNPGAVIYTLVWSWCVGSLSLSAGHLSSLDCVAAVITDPASCCVFLLAFFMNFGFVLHLLRTVL